MEKTAMIFANCFTVRVFAIFFTGARGNGIRTLDHGMMMEVLYLEILPSLPLQ
jgi:hypothetical protein